MKPEALAEIIVEGLTMLIADEYINKLKGIPAMTIEGVSINPEKLLKIQHAVKLMLSTEEGKVMLTTAINSIE